MGVFRASLLFFAFFLITAAVLSAQTPGPASGAEEDPAVSPRSSPADESAIIIEDAPEAPAAAGGSSVLVVFRMVLVLALAALAIYGVVFFIKRLARPRESRDPHLKILARAPLSGDTFAAVISVGAKAWLVGGGSGSVGLISEIDDTEVLETLLLEDAERTAAEEARRIFDFRALLGRLTKQPREETPPSAAHAERLRKQRERLRGL